MSAHPFLFLKRFLAAPGAVGAILPSGKTLAHLMAAQINPHGRTLEIGADTGALTEGLLNRITDQSHLTSVEMDPALADTLHCRFPNIRLIMSDAEEVLQQETRWDAVVSGIPFAVMEPEKRTRMFRLIGQRLNPEGVFVAFQYSLSSQKELKQIFQRVDVHFTLLNIPPAVVYVCREPII